ncbi:MAG: F0F1 ATP synthase subunit A [Brevibacterium sp.]
MVPLDTGGGYTPPGLEDFVFDGGFIPGVDWVNKPLVQAVISVILILAFWLIVSRKLKLIPGKGQFAAEYLYDFIRNGVARDMIGHNWRPYMPYLLGLFCFLLVNNLFGLIPVFMFPTFSNIGYAWGLALMSWVIYNVAGVKKLGLKYFKNSLMPAGVPLWLAPIIVPVEFLSNFIIRPITLGLRLFGNLLGGHLVVLVFVVGGSYLLTQADSIAYNITGAFTLLFSFAIFALELLVVSLQAYIFTVLTASYVASATSEEH